MRVKSQVIKPAQLYYEIEHDENNRPRDEYNSCEIPCGL